MDIRRFTALCFIYYISHGNGLVESNVGVLEHSNETIQSTTEYHIQFKNASAKEKHGEGEILQNANPTEEIPLSGDDELERNSKKSPSEGDDVFLRDQNESGSASGSGSFMPVDDDIDSPIVTVKEEVTNTTSSSPVKNPSKSSHGSPSDFYFDLTKDAGETSATKTLYASSTSSPIKTVTSLERESSEKTDRMSISPVIKLSSVDPRVTTDPLFSYPQTPETPETDVFTATTGMPVTETNNNTESYNVSGTFWSDLLLIKLGPFTFLQAVGLLAGPLVLAMICACFACLCTKRKRKIPKVLADIEAPDKERLVDPSQLSESTCHRVPLSEWRNNLDKDYMDIEDVGSEIKRRSLHMTFGVGDEEEGNSSLEVPGREQGNGACVGARSAPSTPGVVEWDEEEGDIWREGYMDMRKSSLSSLSPTSMFYPRPVHSALTNSTSALYAVPRVRREEDYVIPSPLVQNTLTQSSSENILSVNLYDVPRRYRSNTGPALPNRYRNRAMYQRPTRAGLHTSVPSPLVGYQQPRVKAKASSPGASPELQRRTLPSGDTYTLIDKDKKAEDGYLSGPARGWRQTNISNDSGYMEPRKYT